MSLIQEALRRKDDDEGGPAIPPRIIPPAVSPAQRGSGAPSGKAKAPGSGWLVVALMLVVILIVVAGVGLYGFIYRPKPQATAGLPAAPVPEVAAPAAAEPPPIAALAPAAPVAAEPSAVLPVPAPAPVAEVVAEPVVPLPVAPPMAAPAQPGPAPVAMVPAASAPEAPVPAAAPAADPGQSGIVVPLPVTARWKDSFSRGKARSTWPSVKVVGVLARTDPRDCAAIVDGSMVVVGEDIEGVRLVDVDPSGALFAFQGQTQYVRVGHTTK